jgi:FkbM family methyltransferase
MINIFKYKLKLVLKKMIRKCGYDIQTVEANYYYQVLKVLSLKNVNLIIDVGANIGQFASEIRATGYDKRIISIEPILSCNKKLKILSFFDNKWSVLEPLAIGSEDGYIEINVSKNFVSSSILGITEQHLKSENESIYSSKQIVKINSLDQAVYNLIDNDSIIMIKIDTQGYEYNVLEGATKILKVAKAVVMELSAVELYNNQKLSEEMIAYMKWHGFELWNIKSEFFNKDGKSIQYDALFVRE